MIDRPFHTHIEVILTLVLVNLCPERINMNSSECKEYQHWKKSEKFCHFLKKNSQNGHFYSNRLMTSQFEQKLSLCENFPKFLEKMSIFSSNLSQCSRLHVQSEKSGENLSFSPKIWKMFSESYFLLRSADHHTSIIF